MKPEWLDHDQRFKAMIREFFADFLRLFFADWAARFDLSSVEWLDKELHAEPPEGSRHLLDLVARLKTLEPPNDSATGDPTTWITLIHIEIESADRTTTLKPRLPGYYFLLRERHQCPILPIVLYLKVGLDGIGSDEVVDWVWDFDVNRFKYLYVGLPGLDAETYLRGENWLGVALSALMKIPRDRVAWLGAEALRKLCEAPLTDQQRFLLGECVQAYLPLDAEQQAVFEDIIMGGNSKPGVQAMNKTYFDRGVEQGLIEGREEGREEGRNEGRNEGRRIGQVDVVIALLESRFGSVPNDLLEKLNQFSDDELKRLAVRTMAASSLAELGL